MHKYNLNKFQSNGRENKSEFFPFKFSQFIGNVLVRQDIYFFVFVRTQFEIECMCGGHSVTKKFMTILQILVAKLKLWRNLYFYKEYIFNLKNNFFWLKSWKMLLAVPKNDLLWENFTRKIRHTFWQMVIFFFF